MSNRYRNVLIKLGIFSVVAVLITVSVIATLLDLKEISLPLIGKVAGQSSSSYHALFTNATGLESGDVVRIAGVEVGKVSGVGFYDGKPVAKVDFSMNAADHLTTNSTADIAFENLLGQRYLDIQLGSPGGQTLHSGYTIPMSRTQPGLDLTTVFSGVQPLLAALNPQQVNDLTGSIIAIFQGESGAVSNLISQTAQLTTNLASKQAIINTILDNLGPALEAANSRSAQLSQLIDGLDSLVHGVAGESGSLGGAVTGLGNLTKNASQLLANIQPALDNDLAGLDSTTQEVLQNQSSLNSVLVDLPSLLNSLSKVSDSGNYLTVYVCDLTVHLSNPVSVKLSPTVPQSPPLSVPTGFIGLPLAAHQPVPQTPVCSQGGG